VDATETAQDAPVAKAGEQAAATEGGEVLKADGDGGKPAQVAVYDADGNLVGVANPDDITPLANVKAPAKSDDAGEVAAEPPADPADMTPQPPADAGTPADAVDDDGTVAKSSDQEVFTVLESIVAKAVAAALDGRGPAEDIAKQADVAGLTQEVETLKARLATVEEQPAAPKVFTNGQTPPAHQLRGQDQGARQVDVAKAMARKAELYSADGPEQARIAKEMQQEAIDVLAAIRVGR
jgi:hypothetical protein